MNLDALTCLSPLDGRYRSKLSDLQSTLSEHGLVYFRVLVEIHWLIFLSEEQSITELDPFSEIEKSFLLAIIDEFSVSDTQRIKTIEATTNHDVKAVEYFIQEQLKQHATLARCIPWIHFACTSEDINNLAYALMAKKARDTILIPRMEKLIETLTNMGQEYIDISMLSRTHGQSASPTTLGKECINVVARLSRQLSQFKSVEILGKLNGAVGNFNAHYAAYPNSNWMQVSQGFVESLGLNWNPLTTQIEPHDWTAEWMHHLIRFNTILIDLDRDFWSYISMDYFSQRRVDSEVGSSTMPHKINPIDFENSEGNLGIANALATHFAEKLPLSRWQRDLTDSTVLRNYGVIVGHSVLAFESTLKGLSKLIPNLNVIANDLDAHWEVLGEAIQTVMRKYGIADAYEQLKAFSRGEKLDRPKTTAFIEQLEIPEHEKQRLLSLSPDRYIGLAESLCKTLL